MVYQQRKVHCEQYGSAASWPILQIILRRTFRSEMNFCSYLVRKSLHVSPTSPASHSSSSGKKERFHHFLCFSMMPRTCRADSIIWGTTYCSGRWVLRPIYRFTRTRMSKRKNSLVLSINQLTAANCCWACCNFVRNQICSRRCEIPVCSTNHRNMTQPAAISNLAASEETTSVTNLQLKLLHRVHPRPIA